MAIDPDSLLRDALTLPADRRVDGVLSVLATWPRTGSIIEDTPANLEIRRAPASRFRFHDAYLVLDDQVRVLAVAHDHRKPGYWHPRVGR